MRAMSFLTCAIMVRHNFITFVALRHVYPYTAQSSQFCAIHLHKKVNRMCRLPLIVGNYRLKYVLKTRGR